MLLCPYCSFSNPETATHCLGCGNDMPPDAGLGLVEQDVSISTPPPKAPAEDPHAKRRGTSNFANKDDHDVLGDMDAALDTLLRDDLTMGGSKSSSKKPKDNNASVSQAKTGKSLRPKRNDHESSQTQEGLDAAPTADLSEHQIPTRLSPRAPTGKFERPGSPPARREEEYTAISPVDPETWQGIVKQAKQGLLSEDDPQVPPAAHTMPPSMARSMPRRPEATNTEAPTASRELPRPPMVGKTTRHAPPPPQPPPPRGPHKPETTERIDLKELQKLIVEDEDDESSAPRLTSSPPPDATPHQPDATDRMGPSSWADIALARQQHKKPAPLPVREPTNIERIEELGLESIVDESEEDLTVADAGKLAKLRDELRHQWEQPSETAKSQPPPLSAFDTHDGKDDPAPTPRELQGAHQEHIDLSEHVDLDDHDHTLGAAPLSDADVLLAQGEESWAAGSHTPEQLDSPNAHTLGGERVARDRTERWFEQDQELQRFDEIPDHASTLFGATPPTQNEPRGPMAEATTQKTRGPQDDATTYLYVVLDVEAPRSDDVLRKSTRMQALEGLGELIAERLRDDGLFVDTQEDDRLVASINGNAHGLAQAIRSAQQTIEDVNRHDVPVAARLRVRCVITTVTTALAHPQERAQAISGRLLRGMPVDRIWLDWTSYCALDDSHRCQEVVLPSLEEPAYEVESLEHSAKTTLTSTNNDEEELPWLGRQREMDTLLHHWNATKNGESRLVLLLGAPGSGRSRFLDVFCQQMVGHGGYLFRGASRFCPSDTNTTPYLSGLLASYLQHHGIDRNRGLRQQISALAGVDNLSPQQEERTAQLLLELSTEGPSGDDGATEQALSWLMRASTSQMPTIAIFDDIFLFDRRTGRLLDTFLQQIPPRMMVVVISTPGEYEEVLFSSMAQAQRIELPAFTTQESRQLLNHLKLPNELTHKQIDRMVDEAEGNPRLLVTLAQATRKTQKREITWSYDLAVPNAVERLMLQRQRGLSHLEKDTLRKAAVIGDRFWKGAVECLERLELNDGSWGLREGVVISHVDDRTGCLNSLVEKELLQKVPHSSLPHEQEYRFPHRLLRRILMRQIPVSIRQQMHRHLAQWLTLRDEEHVLAFEIARHLKMAGDPEGATWRLYESAQDVLEQHRYTQALSMLAEALETLGDRNPVLRLQLLDESAKAYEYVGDINAATQLFENALQLSWRMTSAAWGGKLFVSLSRCLTLKGEFQQAQSHLLDARALAQRTNDRIALCAAQLQMIHIHLLQGELNEAEAALPEARKEAHQLGQQNPALWGQCQSLEGWLHRLKGRWREAIKSFQDAGRVWLDQNNQPMYAQSLLDQAEFYMTAGDEDSAQPLLDEACEILRNTEAFFALQKGLLLLAQISLSRRDTHKALESLREAWQHNQVANDPGMRAQIAAALSSTYVLSRQPTEATRFAKLAIQRLKEGPSRTRATTYYFLGEAAASMTPEQLNDMFNPAPPRLPEGGMPTFLFLKSVELFKRAKESARQVGTLLSLGRSLLIGGHQQTAINVLERGINDANKLGLGLLLERLRNQRRLLSQEDPIQEMPELSSSSSSSTLVVRKNRQQNKKPFASETQAHKKPQQVQRPIQPNPYAARNPQAHFPGGAQPDANRPAAPPNPYVSPQADQRNAKMHQMPTSPPPRSDQSTNILPTPRPPRRHKEKP